MVDKVYENMTALSQNYMKLNKVYLFIYASQVAAEYSLSKTCRGKRD
jgi:hypothetical protein